MPGTAIEIITALKDPLNILAGGLVAVVGAAVQSRLSHAQAKSKLRLEKLERAYSLCQQVYDGYQRELYNLKSNRLSRVATYVDQHQRPGPQMSELKMLVRCYTPTLERTLETMNVEHTQLKELTKRIYADAIAGQTPAPDEFAKDCANADAWLACLGDCSNAMKQELSRMVRPHAK
jgi:hypothetical protein